MKLTRTVAVAALAWACLAVRAAEEGPGVKTLTCDRIPHARFGFEGVVGDRVRANVANWLVPAPEANPGMLGMFRMRDRTPPPDVVPWAGEFVGKYLISAIQARRMSSDAALDSRIREVVAELVSVQAEDGYLGPFPLRERLLGHWDLWGHYHCLTALMMWYDETGDEAARDAALRAADLICRTYPEGGRRPIEAGSPEMNLSVIHVLGWLHRDTGEPRYLDLMRRIEADFERAGDYVRAGLAGTPFYRTPAPRWESLHAIQGLVELHRITGEARYRTAFENLWRSMARFDRHNTGGFTTNEQAVGSPYEPGAIETCCTTAWVALSIDMLRLTGEPGIADELEWSTLNSVLGSQHPSGRWWTYDTPMDGTRKASAHSIVFQARAGTPELNCCSVNAPRGLGMLSEWAVMEDDEGIFVNYYGPGDMSLPLRSGTRLTVRQRTEYPAKGDVRIEITPERPSSFAARFRIPAWSRATKAALNGEPLDPPPPGAYLTLSREWRAGDRLDLEFDMGVRALTGDGPCSGKVSLFAGPLLLAFDQNLNPFDANDLPPIDMHELTVTPGVPAGRFPPITVRDVTGADGRRLRLCDFATAGANGTEYRSWLPALHTPPPPFHLLRPEPETTLPAGPTVFRWSGGNSPKGCTYTLRVFEPDGGDGKTVFESPPLARTRYVLRDAALQGSRTYRWSVISRNEEGSVTGTPESSPFRIDPTLSNPLATNPASLEFRDDGLACADPLRGEGAPLYGHLLEARNVHPGLGRDGAPGGSVEFSGDGLLRYGVPLFPEEDFTFLAWVCPLDLPTGRIAQVFSAWCRSMDDPLRITLDGGNLHARIEAGIPCGTRGAPVRSGQWIHVAAVKHGTALTLFIDGRPIDTASVPRTVFSEAADMALGGNPHYSGNESFRGRIAEFALYARAVSAEEIGRIAGGEQPFARDAAPKEGPK